jgi:hypothetical protein
MKRAANSRFEAHLSAGVSEPYGMSSWMTSKFP